MNRLASLFRHSCVARRASLMGGDEGAPGISGAEDEGEFITVVVLKK